MTTPISDDFEACIINELMLAQQSIKIAVAWFNSKDILKILCWKLRKKVSVEVILQYDNINSGNEYSLDFTEYNKLGGLLIWAKREKSTMHVKFCIIDGKVLLHGSCNWTYSAFHKNDEVLNVTKDEPNVINSYLSNFASLKEKYTSPVIHQKKTGHTTYKGKKKVSKDERIRLFVEEMNRCDIQQYSTEYIKSFMSYWTGNSTNYAKYSIEPQNREMDSLKMRFEEKADFVMMLELEDWGRKQLQIKEEEDYKRFYESFRSEAREAYEKYCQYIDDNSPWPDFNERLEQLNNEIEKNSEVYKNTQLKDVFPQWSERQGKNTYDFLMRHHLPMIITTSDLSSVVIHRVQYGVYSYKKGQYIETGTQDEVPSWLETFRGKSTIQRLEEHFHCTFLEYVQVPERMLRPSFENYSKRYIESCVYNSNFSYKLKSNSNERILTKGRLRVLLEAAYAIKVYNYRMRDYTKKYGHILLSDILNNDEIYIVKDRSVGDYLTRCFFELEIKYNYRFPRELFVIHNIHIFGSKSLHSDYIIPKINKALNIHIEFPEEISDLGGSTYYILSDDVYYARDDFKFLSLEEVCGIDKGIKDFKTITWYYKEIMSWNK